MTNTLIRLFRAAVATCCAYETTAIVTDRIPTISNLCARRRWLTPVIVGGLTVHLAHVTRTVRDLAEAEDITP